MVTPSRSATSMARIGIESTSRAAGAAGAGISSGHGPPPERRPRHPPGPSGTRRARPRAGLQERHQPRAAAGRPGRPARPSLRGALDADDTLAFAAGLRSLWASPSEARAGDLARAAAPAAASRPPRPTSSAPRRAPRPGSCSPPAPPARAVYRFDAAPQLRRRPLAPLLERAARAGRAHGAGRRRPACRSRWWLAGSPAAACGSPGDTSSQFISALLMAAPLGRAPLELHVDGLVSRPYVDMTLRDDGAVRRRRRARRRRALSSSRRAPTRARDYAVEPDASTASYFFAAAAVTGGRVQVLGLHRARRPAGRRRASSTCSRRWAARSATSPTASSVAGPAALAGLTVDMGDISGHVHDPRRDRPVRRPRR